VRLRTLALAIAVSNFLQLIPEKWIPTGDHASTIEAEICPSRQRFSRPANWEGTVIRVLDCRLTTIRTTKLSERIYRDPVHNIIRLRTDSSEGELMMRLIDTPEFQRLRRIKQLGLGLYTYQGAEHSRFTHSLGAFHLMTRVLDRLSEKHSINEQDHTAARAAALLHDVGHGSFSHVMEKVLGLHHEKWTVEVVLSEATEIGQQLRSYSADLPEKVAAIIEGKFQPAALGQLVSSQLDVDRMDYLLRDSLMTGAKYGIYDLEWIINALSIDEQHDRIFVAARGLYAVEEYLQARYYMFRQVYFHRTLRSAEAVLSDPTSRSDVDGKRRARLARAGHRL